MKTSLGAKTLACPLPVWCIGSYDEDERPNVMTASWTGICCSKPPAITVSLRKATYTYHNIMRAKAFTVNIPSAAQAVEVDHVGIVSGRDTDKFAAVGWTPVPSQLVHAPYVEECPLVFECALIHTLEIGLHTQFVGEILDVKADPAALSDGKVDLAKVAPFVYAAASQDYFSVGTAVGRAFKIGKR